MGHEGDVSLSLVQTPGPETDERVAVLRSIEGKGTRVHSRAGVSFPRTADWPHGARRLHRRKRADHRGDGARHPRAVRGACDRRVLSLRHARLARRLRLDGPALAARDGSDATGIDARGVSIHLSMA